MKNTEQKLINYLAELEVPIKYLCLIPHFFEYVLKESGEPYLVNGADGVNGHYAIVRHNTDKNCREVWSDRNESWGSAGDVFKLGIKESL